MSFALERRLPENTARKFYHVMMWLCLLTHVAFLVATSILQITPLMICNVIAIALFAFGVFWVQRTTQTVTWLLLVYGLVLIHAVMCNIYLGWGYGFSFYPILLIPISYYVCFLSGGFTVGRKDASILSLLIVLVISGAYAFDAFLFGVDVNVLGDIIDNNMMILIMVLNICVCATMLVAFSVFFIRAISSTWYLLRRKSRELDFLEAHDSLTGLRNRYNISAEFQRIASSGEEFCIMITDIDDLKIINDEYGDNAGDRCIKYVADAVTKTIGDCGVACRWGGEEILAIVKLPKGEGIVYAAEICDKIRTSLVQVEGNAFNFTVTIGFASVDESENSGQLVNLVYERLAYGKLHGKDQIVFED